MSFTSPSQPRLILASQSPQRRAILETLGIPFEVKPANIDEAAIQDPSPFVRAGKLAKAKAEKIQAENPEAIIVAGDTFVWIANHLMYEKPQDLAEAKKMLLNMQATTITVITGVCYLDPHREVARNEIAVNKARFRELSESEIEYYINTQPVTTWSGGFSPAYLAGMALFAEVTAGSFTAFTHGLPIERVAVWLRSSELLK
jgi:septum formation protein